MAKLTWLGRSCFELKTQHQQRVLFDPYLELYRAQQAAPYPPPDMICVSHGHLDHFADVPDLIRGESPSLVVAASRLCRALREWKAPLPVRSRREAPRFHTAEPPACRSF